MKKILLFLAVLFSLTINGQEHRAHIFINLSDTLCQDSSHLEVIDKLNVGIIPMPKLVTQFDSFDGLEYFVLDNTCMLIDSEDEEISRIVNVLRKDINDITGMDLNVSKKTNKKNKPIHFSLYTPERIEEMSKSRKTDIIGLGIGPNLDSIPGRKPNPQEYVISISSNGIIISAPTHQGLFYGAQSLKQLIRHQILTENNLEIPCYYIFDLPSLEYRGWMDDISRGPIPTMEFIKEEIRRLAEYKFNFFNLYTEHLFKLENYPDIAPTDGLTAEEIKELTEFAKDYYIEFVGNQQCFAHAEKTLDNPFYDDIKDTRFNFNPGVEETYEFLEELLGETAQAYESKYFNINCDETEGLGN